MPKAKILELIQADVNIYLSATAWYISQGEATLTCFAPVN